MNSTLDAQLPPRGKFNETRAFVEFQGDSTEDIQATIEDAPLGAIIFFPANTYLITRTIYPREGQCLYGPGAVFEREPARTTTLLQDANDGDTSIFVTDPTVYRVGNFVTPIRTGGGDPDIEVKRHNISAIKGNELVLHRAIESSYKAGDMVSNYFTMIRSTTEPFSVDGITFRGNRKSQVFLSWKRNRTILGGVGLEVRNCRFEEMPGDGIDTAGGDVLIEDNIFSQCDVAGIHLSNDPIEEGDTIIRRNVFSSTNLNYQIAEHSEGAITISARNNHIRVIDNVCINCSAAFIGDFHIYMHDWTIDNNLVINASRGLFRGKQNNNGPTPLQDVIVKNNKVLDSAVSILDTLLPIEGVEIFDNVFRGASVELIDVFGSFSNNVVWTCGEIPLNIVGGNVQVSDNDLLENQCGPSFEVGDLNCNGIHDLLDVNMFVSVLVDDYYHPIADIDQSGQVDILDIQPFVDLLTK